MGQQELFNEDIMWDGYIAGKEDEFERAHPKCPICGTPMNIENEYVDGDRRYSEKLYICPKCDQ